MRVTDEWLNVKAQRSYRFKDRSHYPNGTGDWVRCSAKLDGLLTGGRHAHVFEHPLTHRLLDRLMPRIRDTGPVLTTAKEVEAIFAVVLTDRKPGDRLYENARDDLVADT
jgi:hypothetical protein